jgi:hypothetical protein
MALDGQSMEHFGKICSAIICFLLLSISKLYMKYHGHYINFYFKSDPNM